MIIIGILSGWVYGFVDETQDLGEPAWWCFNLAAVLLAAFGVALGNRNSENFRPSLKAMPVLVATLLALTLGHFSAYALGIDGRSLANYGGSMAWGTNLLATLSMAMLFGSLLGVLSALVSHMVRRSLQRTA
jgi:hypothetical protein